MRSILSLLAALGLMATPAPVLAGEMDVTWQTLPAGSRGGVTMLDVVAGTIPALELKGPEGEQYRLSLEVKPEANDVVTIEGLIERAKVKRNGTVTYKEVARPIVSTTDGQKAEISFTPKGGVTFELVFEPRLSDGLNRPPIIERDDAPAPAPREEAPSVEEAAVEAPADEAGDTPAVD